MLLTHLVLVYPFVSGVGRGYNKRNLFLRDDPNLTQLIVIAEGKT